MTETERLLLRDWRDGDFEQFDRHTNTESVMRWLGGVRGREDLLEIANRLRRWQAERGFTFWAVERKADGAFLGFCGLKISDSPNGTVPGELEIGWRFREDSWGRGYAREAAAACFDHAFQTLRAERVVAITVGGNEASWGLMLRLGMKRRPELDFDDPRFLVLNPAIVYVIEREEWKP